MGLISLVKIFSLLSAAREFVLETLMSLDISVKVIVMYSYQAIISHSKIERTALKETSRLLLSYLSPFQSPV